MIDNPASPAPITARLVSRWQSFWFDIRPAYPLGLIRIAFGALMVAWTLSLLPDLRVFFGPNGLMPRPFLQDGAWSVFALWNSDMALLIGWCVLLICSVALTLGWHSRLAAVMVFVLVVSLQRRDILVFNSGDVLIRIEALFLAVSPCGAALSLDRRRAVGRFWSAQDRAVWPIRLFQVQLSLIYLTTVYVKLDGNGWRDGSAVSYALRIQDMLIVSAPQWITTDQVLMNIATWGTVMLEIALGVLVWNRLCRPWVLTAGLVMHTMIMVSICIGFFSLAMFVLYLAFVPPDFIARRGFGRLATDVHHAGPEDDVLDRPPLPVDGDQQQTDGEQHTRDGAESGHHKRNAV